MHDQLRDELLMAQVVRGKQDALEPLVRRYAGALLNFIDRMIGDVHRSEELFQEVFLAVWSKRRSYQYPRPFRSWLFAIAVNKCREAYRDRELDNVRLDGHAAGLIAHGAGPPEAAIAGENMRLVAEAVTRLPTQQRAVVVLRIWQQLSFAEIAEVLSTSESTARSNMHHGLGALRRFLEPRLK